MTCGHGKGAKEGDAGVAFGTSCAEKSWRALAVYYGGTRHPKRQRMHVSAGIIRIRAFGAGAMCIMETSVAVGGGLCEAVLVGSYVWGLRWGAYWLQERGGKGSLNMRMGGRERVND